MVILRAISIRGPVPPYLVHLRGQNQAAVIGFGARHLWQPDRGPGNPAATAPLFSLQRDFSGYYDCLDSQNDCTQADGSGYYVVPAGVLSIELNPNWRAWEPDKTTWPKHDEFTYAFVDDAFIGEKWHADAAFKWLGDAAFGA